MGSSGVGKTELAKALAELFDDENLLVRIDMSQYMDHHSVACLIGAPTGYVGARQLTEAVRRRPYSVVLFDEVEKAHHSVCDILLQVLDDGRLRDGQGRTVDFTNTVIIMTSNLGAEHLVPGLSGNTTMQAAAGDKVMQQVKMHFRPEFFDRLDVKVIFKPLSPDQLREVARLQMQDVTNRLAERGIALAVSDAALDYALSQCYDDSTYGAISGWLEMRVVTELSKMLRREEIDENSTVSIDAAAGGKGLSYHVENNGGL
uniref:Uncharacterized protein n=1 Tax=Kalanchoe fedtschenkoi TaxID=63787 RepID=A0A7N0U4K3_KALFE